MTDEIQECRRYFEVHNTRVVLVDSTGTLQTSSSTNPVLLDDRKDKFHFLEIKENFPTVYSFSKL